VTPSPDAGAPRRRRWWYVVTAVTVVAVVVVMTGLWWVRDGRYDVARRGWQPTDALLPPMRDQPIPGWRIRVTDLGLPAPVDGTGPSRIAVGNEPGGPRPIVGTVGDDAFLLAISGSTPRPQWWLAGINVRDGRSLFPAVALTTTRPPECFLNGPAYVLCLSVDASPTAWVIDTKTGAVAYTGPTDLRTASETLSVRQIGGYAVAETDGQGVYGIGLRAETTWFVPGHGRAQPDSPRLSGRALSAVATQGASAAQDQDTTVFALDDGTIVKPEVPEGAPLKTTFVYAGGFAADVESASVLFFDEGGKRLGDAEGSLSTDQSELPVVTEHDVSTVYSPAGAPLLRSKTPPPSVVGTTAFVSEAGPQGVPLLRQYDLKTGAKGSACEFSLKNYLGTDGSVLVLAVGNPGSGAVAKAIDRATCDTLWTLPAEIDSLARVWGINSTLVRLSDDGTELWSLVSPT